MSNSNDLHAWYQDGEINEADPVSPQLNINTKSSTFGIAPGYEMHFDGMDNLSPYIAFELPIVIGNRSDTQGSGDHKTSTMRVSLTSTSFGTWATSRASRKSGSTSSSVRTTTSQMPFISDSKLASASAARRLATTASPPTT